MGCGERASRLKLEWLNLPSQRLWAAYKHERVYIEQLRLLFPSEYHGLIPASRS